MGNKAITYTKITASVLLFLSTAVAAHPKTTDKRIFTGGKERVIAEKNSAVSNDNRVIYFNSAAISAAFKKGTTSLIKFGSYNVLACHRETAGVPEIHTKNTDIFYILEGSATLVTGGILVGGHRVSSDEIRGKEIIGGEAYRLNRGDVIIIPKNTAHWFKEVPGPFYYFAVKIAD